MWFALHRVGQTSHFFARRSRFLHLPMSCPRQTRLSKLSNQVTVQRLLSVHPLLQVSVLDSVVWWVWWLWLCCFFVVVFYVRVYRFRFLGGFWLFRVSFGLFLWRFGRCIFGVRGRWIRLVLLLLIEVVLSHLYLHISVSRCSMNRKGEGQS